MLKQATDASPALERFAGSTQLDHSAVERAEAQETGAQVR